ncbi:MAG TPA: hypothetical protein VHL08_08410 [Dongiaceae bacterium]|jgi:hypothetical protein|nr:hypothetical protein [Dongiaceae bacterium]
MLEMKTSHLEPKAARAFGLEYGLNYWFVICAQSFPEMTLDLAREKLAAFLSGIVVSVPDAELDLRKNARQQS